MPIRITCITKAGGRYDDPHRGIAWLGWINEQTRQRGVASRDEMYDFVRRGGLAFTQDGPLRAQLVAYVSRAGDRCVKTIPDSAKKDNLLNVDGCS